MMARKKRRRRPGRCRRLRLFALIILVAIVFGHVLQDIGEHWFKADQKLSVGLDQKAAFIKKIAPYAQESAQKSHVFPSVVIAQACLESSFGQSQLAQDYGNLFGIKAAKTGSSQALPTQEFLNGEWETKTEHFATYPSWRAAVFAHGDLMQNGTAWNKDLYQPVVQAQSPTEATQALQNAGYATDPHYAEKLNELIVTYQLTQYDQ